MIPTLPRCPRCGRRVSRLSNGELNPHDTTVHNPTDRTRRAIPCPGWTLSDITGIPG